MIVNVINKRGQWRTIQNAVPLEFPGFPGPWYAVMVSPVSWVIYDGQTGVPLPINAPDRLWPIIDAWNAAYAYIQALGLEAWKDSARSLRREQWQIRTGLENEYE